MRRPNGGNDNEHGEAEGRTAVQPKLERIHRQLTKGTGKKRLAWGRGRTTARNDLKHEREKVSRLVGQFWSIPDVFTWKLRDSADRASGGRHPGRLGDSEKYAQTPRPAFSRRLTLSSRKRDCPPRLP
jgi:hypothetical protein